MQESIALIAPALVALGFYNHLHRNRLKTRNLVFGFGIFALFINLCSFLIILFLFGADSVSFKDKEFVHYLLISGGLALVLPLVVNLIENTIAIEVKKNAKK